MASRPLTTFDLSQNSKTSKFHGHRGVPASSSLDFRCKTGKSHLQGGGASMKDALISGITGQGQIVIWPSTCFHSVTKCMASKGDLLFSLPAGYQWRRGRRSRHHCAPWQYQGCQGKVI